LLISLLIIINKPQIM